MSLHRDTLNCHSPLAVYAPPPLVFAMEEEATSTAMPVSNDRNPTMLSTNTKNTSDAAEIMMLTDSYSPTQLDYSQATSPVDTLCSCRQASSSIRSSSTHSSSQATTTSRRDSGYSSKRRGSSRSSSKHSIPSAREFVTGDKSSPGSVVPRRPHPRRVVSVSRMPTSLPRTNTHGALALHERSLQLFGSSSSGSSQSTLPGNPSDRRERAATLSRTISSPQASMLSSSLPSSIARRTESVRRSRQARPDRTNTLPSSFPVVQRTPLTRAQTTSAITPAHVEGDLSESQTPDVVPTTVMHWTSNETRRREYDAIDKQSRGFRGLWNKIRPRMLRSKTDIQGFYDPNRELSDDDDAGSVRRYRLKLEDD
jgi:hypothetical protein